MAFISKKESKNSYEMNIKVVTGESEQYKSNGNSTTLKDASDKKETNSTRKKDETRDLKELYCRSTLEGPISENPVFFENHCAPPNFPAVIRYGLPDHLAYLNVLIDGLIEETIQSNQKLLSLFDVNTSLEGECYILVDVVEKVSISKIYKDFVSKLIDIQKNYYYNPNTVYQVSIEESIKVFGIYESYLSDLKLLARLDSANLRLKTGNEINFGKHDALCDVKTHEIVFKTMLIDYFDSLYKNLASFNLSTVNHYGLFKQKKFLLKKTQKLERFTLKNHYLHSKCNHHYNDLDQQRQNTCTFLLKNIQTENNFNFKGANTDIPIINDEITRLPTDDQYHDINSITNYMRDVEKMALVKTTGNNHTSESQPLNGHLFSSLMFIGMFGIIVLIAVLIIKKCNCYRRKNRRDVYHLDHQ